VLALTSGVRFSLQQGYTSVAAAHAAFELAQRNGWTCRDASWPVAPRSASQAPLPLTDDPASTSSSTPPSPFTHVASGDAWYVVYAGVNPGVFRTRCAFPGVHLIQ
jgi:hypothetical protein